MLHGHRRLVLDVLAQQFSSSKAQWTLMDCFHLDFEYTSLQMTQTSGHSGELVKRDCSN